jgi:hypothetical protein
MRLHENRIDSTEDGLQVSLLDHHPCETSKSKTPRFRLTIFNGVIAPLTTKKVLHVL